MQIQVNTDDHVEGREALVDWVQAEVGSALSRYSQRLTRVEVHLGDENAGKAGSNDKRAMIEARPAGQNPLSVTHQAATLEEACAGACRKLRSALDTKFGQLHDRKGAESIRDFGE